MSSISKEKHSTQTKMNSTNLYVTTTQIILKSDPNNPGSWQDLYRLVPYLRNSLCCVVCSNLLVEPQSPVNAQCQHHVCKRCKGGRKRLKPACENCKDCQDYGENKSLRILMQMYKKMCLTIMNSAVFLCIKSQACQPGTGFERGASNLIQLIREGAQFEDDYKSQGGLPKSTYSILPCIYTKSSCSQNVPALQNLGETSKNLQCSSQNRSLYSVVYPGSGNKITIKRKPKDSTNSNTTNSGVVNSINSCKPKEISEKGIFKKPCIKAKKGCRCGNATATPGKLTCCGQRCPCYVESKACIDCKCRGCRNPHRPDGNKVMPYLQELDSSQIVMSSISEMRLQHLQLLPTSSQQHSQQILDDTMQPVKLEGLQLDTQFFTTDAMNQQYKAYKLLGSGFDPIQSLTPSDLITYGLSEEDDDTEITVV